MVDLLDQKQTLLTLEQKLQIMTESQPDTPLHLSSFEFMRFIGKKMRGCAQLPHSCSLKAGLMAAAQLHVMCRLTGQASRSALLEEQSLSMDRVSEHLLCMEFCSPRQHTAMTGAVLSHARSEGRASA